MYYGNNDYRDYIQHAKDHRYIYKEWKNGKWKYYYPEDEALGRLKDKKGYALVRGVRTAKSNLRKAKKDFIKKHDHDGDGKFTKKGLIDRFDYNKTGKIGKSDLKKELQFQKIKAKGAAKSALYKTDKAIKKHANLVDTNKDKKISLDEMKTGVKRNKKYVENKIRDRRHDTNKDGTVDKKERVIGTSKDYAKKAKKAAKKATKTAKRNLDEFRFDTNRDGKTTHMEYAKGRVGDVVRKQNSPAKKVKKAAKNAKNAIGDIEKNINRRRYDSNGDGNTSQLEWVKGSAQDAIKKQKRKNKVKKAKKKAKKFIYDHTDKAW